MLEGMGGPVVALPANYVSGYCIPPHSHSRAQLLCATSGVVLVTTAAGRWIIPSEHAIWIPPHIVHAVEIIGDVEMRSLYIAPDAVSALPANLQVVGLTDLMRNLIIDATSNAVTPQDGQAINHARNSLVIELILHDLKNLPVMPLGLPLPTERKLEKLCRQFLKTPTHQVTIDDWAKKMAMSRRSFTRHFQKQLGVSFSLWRQQACLFAALPRLTDGELITNVAMDLGYDSVAAFSTMFRRMMGKSPRLYLKSQRMDID